MALLTTTVARVLFGGPMIIFGLLHFMNAEMMTGLVPAFVPGGILWVYVTGLCLIAAGVSIIIQKMASLACKLLAALLGVFILTIHLPGVLNAATMAGALPNFLKDLALAGGALTLAGVFEAEGV